MMKYSIAIEDKVHRIACSHLLREDGQEDLCFALWNPGTGASRYSGLIEAIILPDKEDRIIHGNVSFKSSYFDKVLSIALSKGKGIAFLHSHPSSGWQDMSDDDIKAEKTQLASRVKATTNLPLIGMTLGNDESWSARFWIKTMPGIYKRIWCENVRVVGNNFKITFNNCQNPIPEKIEELSRTISAWGIQTQSKISRLTVGIVGLGSVGSIIAESLVRIGVKHLILIDFDSLETKNLDRILGATHNDIGKAKVTVISDSIKKSAVYSDTIIETTEWSICEKNGFKKTLDCDILFSCVDRPWPRFVLNFIAFAYLIPVIDGGIRATTNNTNTKIKSADWKTHTITPGRVCMECLGQFDSALVELEKSGLLDDPEYIKGINKGKLLSGNENVFAFSISLASLEIQQFLSLIIAPYGIILNPKIYHFITGDLEDNSINKCNENCSYDTFTAQGDLSGIIVTGQHKIAEEYRALRKKLKFTEIYSLSFVKRILIWLRRIFMSFQK